MKRVVVTGLGMVSPLACGVEPTWRKLLAGESAAAKVENFDVSDLPCQIAAQVPRGAAPDAFNPDEWMEPKEQRRVDDFIVYAVSAATQALRDADWAPKTYEEEIETGVLIGSGIGGLRGHRRDGDHPARERPAPRLAVFHPRPADQSRQRSRLDHAQSEGSQPFGGDGLLDRRACDRRRRASRRARRRHRHGRRRRGIGGQSSLARRVRGMPRPVDGIQRPAEAGLAALRSRPRRIRDGRGRRLRRASRSTNTPRRAARRSMPRWSAMAFRATPITLPRPRRTATAAFAPWPRR